MEVTFSRLADGEYVSVGNGGGSTEDEPGIREYLNEEEVAAAANASEAAGAEIPSRTRIWQRDPCGRDPCGKEARMHCRVEERLTPIKMASLSPSVSPVSPPPPSPTRTLGHDGRQVRFHLARVVRALRASRNAADKALVFQARALLEIMD